MSGKKKTYDYLNDKQKALVDKFIDLVTSSPSKGDIMTFCDFTRGKVDSAMDYRDVDKIHQIYPTFDTAWHVNSYEEPTPYGDFRNLGQEVIQKLIQELSK